MEIESWKLSQSVAREALSEPILRVSLRRAEEKHGPNSGEVGLLLMDLADFLTESGRLEEAEIATSQYMSILKAFARELGLGE